MLFAVIFLLVVSAGVGKMVYDVQKFKKRKQNEFNEYNVNENVIENDQS